MKDVLEQAQKLGETILDSEEFIRMRLAEQAVTKDEEATRLIGALMEKRQKVERILADNNLDHSALAQAGADLEETEKQVNALALVAQMQKARGEFTQMMESVNKILRFVVTGEAEEEGEHSCSGSCATCGGCQHEC